MVESPTPPTELTTWQEIADYLSVSVRTAQNYERDFGLPVRRPVGPRGRVVAYPIDLDQWKASRLGVVPSEKEPEASQSEAVDDDAAETRNPAIEPDVVNDPPTKSSWVFFVATSVAGLAILGFIVYYFSHRTSPDPSTFSVEGRLLTVFDEHNRKIWEHVFPGPVNYAKAGPSDYPLYKFVDMGGERKALLFAVADLLYCFRGNGTIAWTYRPRRALTTSQGQVIPVHYGMHLVETLRKPRADGGRIIVGAYLGPGALYVVELLTIDGKKVGEYFHFGWFFTVKTGILDENGSEDIFLAGVDSASGVTPGYGPTLVVLNPDKVEGQAVTLAGDNRAIKGLAIGNEKAVLLIKEFAPNPDPILYCRGSVIALADSFLELKVDQNLPNEPSAHFRFDRHLKLQNVTPSIKLEKILDQTVLKNVPSGQRQEYMLKYLGDIIYVRNGFNKASVRP